MVPIALDEVVLLASSSSAYAIAQEHPDLLKAQLADRRTILREGNHVHLSPVSIIGNGHPGGQAGQLELEYKVVLTTPVHQGYVDIDSTQIIVAASDFDDPQISSGSPVSTTSVSDSSSDEEDSDIDESFLLNSLSKPNGISKSHPDGLIETSHTTSFKVIPLQSRQLLPKDELQELTILMRTADLARLGIFSGDWVSYRSCSIYKADPYESWSSPTPIIAPRAE